MSRISEVFKLNGVNMPTPDEGGIVFGKNPLWSSNSGRVANGLYVGDIIAEKRTVDITISNLTSADVALIEAQLKPFYTVSVVDPTDPTKRITMECYKPPRSYPLKLIRNGEGIYDSVTINCIER